MSDNKIDQKYKFSTVATKIRLGFFWKKTKALREQQEQWPEGKFPWDGGAWDYDSSSQDSRSATTGVSDLTDESDSDGLHDGVLVSQYDNHWIEDPYWNRSRIYIYRNDGKYKAYICQENSIVHRITFPVRKRSREAQAARDAEYADDESD
jgi:hypothetical protein